MGKKRKFVSSHTGKSTSDRDDSGEDSTDHIVLARDRLRRALSHLLESSDNGEELTLQQRIRKEKEREREQQKLEYQAQQQLERRNSVIAARRKRRSEMNSVAYQNTYVMKLFDRSVDLAQFKESTPLYPICRAWMENQPKGQLKNERSMSPEIRTKEEPLDEDDDEDDLNMNGGDDDDDPDDSSPGMKKRPSKYKATEVDTSMDINKMPPPLSPFTMRCPIVKPQVTPGFDFEISEMKAPPRDKLLKDHVKHWVKVRNDWIAASNENEDRYRRSGDILRAVYEKAQKAYE